MQPQQFPSENAKVAFLTSLLTGKALQWAKAIWNSNNPIINSYEQCLARQPAHSLHLIRFSGYVKVLPFGWNEIALLGAYPQGLNLEICAAMAIYDDSIGLESFLQRATQVSQQLAACQPPGTAPHFPVPESMQVDSTWLSHTERNRRITLGLCLYYGQRGHLLRTCPIRPPCPVVSTILFISQDCLKELQLPRHRHHQVYAVTTIQGKPPGHGRVRHSSPFITLQSTVNIILGRPWLRIHHPEFRWDPCDITRWSQMCHTPCLSKLPHPHTVPAPVASTQIESPEPVFTPEVPAEYMAFQDVFSKQAATHLPPHRPWDCAIYLLPGAQLPKGRVYSLSIPEHQAMEDYIAEALTQGFI
ncbi:hypothetical protein M9458_058186 [Cirrhinus mrigala]|uniref:DUF4939 domain-containing protein n=1 Tax=Cirrhinus mrigala TaxID=683832 RepID=A0ABD0MA79_CIRMR